MHNLSKSCLLAVLLFGIVGVDAAAGQCGSVREILNTSLEGVSATLRKINHAPSYQNGPLCSAGFFSFQLATDPVCSFGASRKVVNIDIVGKPESDRILGISYVVTGGNLSPLELASLLGDGSLKTLDAFDPLLQGPLKPRMGDAIYVLDSDKVQVRVSRQGRGDDEVLVQVVDLVVLKALQPDFVACSKEMGYSDR